MFTKGCVAGMMIRAILTNQILWPQKGEDRDEGGWISKDQREGRPRERDVEEGRRRLNRHDTSNTLANDDDEK